MSNYDEEPWAAFVREIGLEPVETESQASRVAGFAAAERDRLQADKAELVAVLEKLSDWGREHTSPHHENSPHQILIEARAVLAKAKGE